MFYVALALGLLLPTSILAWLCLRLELQLRREDKVRTQRWERFGDAAFAALVDLTDDRPFGIRAPRLGSFQPEPINRRF